MVQCPSSYFDHFEGLSSYRNSFRLNLFVHILFGKWVSQIMTFYHLNKCVNTVDLRIQNGNGIQIFSLSFPNVCFARHIAQHITTMG